MFCDAPALMAVNCTFLDNELSCNTAYVPPQLFSSVIYAKTYTVTFYNCIFANNRVYSYPASDLTAVL